MFWINIIIGNMVRMLIMGRRKKMFKITKINVTKSSMPEFAEYVEEIRSIWNNVWLTNMGPKHDQLEQQLCEYLNVLILSRLVDTFFSRISLTMPPSPKSHNTVCV